MESETEEKSLEDEFIEHIKKLPGYPQAEKTARKNTNGNLYLCGGAVHRTIIDFLHGDEGQNEDFDFIGDELTKEPWMPHEEYSTPADSSSRWNYMILTDKRIFSAQYASICVEVAAFKDLETLEGVKNPTINDFITRAPLNIQAIVLDLQNNKIWGEPGKLAILEEKVAVNNPESAERYAHKRGYSVKQYVRAKAKILGFRAEV